MWQFSQAKSALRPQLRRDGAWRVLGATAMTGFDFSAQHEYSVTVAGNIITTKVVATVIDTRADATLTGPGLVGSRTSGNEKATILDATIVSATGATVLKTSFPVEDTSLST